MCFFSITWHLIRKFLKLEVVKNILQGHQWAPEATSTGHCAYLYAVRSDATHLCDACGPLCRVIWYRQLLTMWTIWRKPSYFHLKHKIIWKIMEVHNVILSLQFPFVIQSHLVSSRIVKLDVLQERVQLKEMHHPVMKHVPELRHKTWSRESPSLCVTSDVQIKYNTDIQWSRAKESLQRTKIT
jgi:hypothetical protein